MYGLTKEELDELNRVVEQEEANEKAASETETVEEPAVQEPDLPKEPEVEEPATKEPAPENSLSPEDREFMDVLEKRSEGKNDEVQ